MPNIYQEDIAVLQQVEGNTTRDKDGITQRRVSFQKYEGKKGKDMRDSDYPQPLPPSSAQELYRGGGNATPLPFGIYWPWGNGKALECIGALIRYPAPRMAQDIRPARESWTKAASPIPRGDGDL